MRRQVRLLLVEDSKTYSMLIKGTLREMAKDEYTLKAVETVEQAAATVHDFDPDAILLDLFLPDSEGLDTLRRVKNIFSDKAIVVLSSLDDEETAFQAIREGAQDYLVKSETDPKTMERAIRYARERNQIEQALLQSQKLVRDLLDSIQAGILIVEPTDHRIVDANSVAMEMFKASSQEVIGSVCHRFVCQDQLGRCPITDLGKKSDNSEQQLRQSDGQLMPILKTVALVNLDGRERLVESFLDISSLKKMEEELRCLSLTDELTGIANRRQFMYTASLEAKRARRYGNSISLINVDVDEFKTVNDSLGHHAGDLVLRKLTQLISQELRDSDLFGRVGGEEFAIILPETGLQAAVEVADRLRVRVQSHTFKAEGRHIACTISLGVAAFDPESDDLDSWLKRGDQALYQAKGKGRNRVEALEA
ncbi:MAG: diguanylate cyclase [Proteobacteria bacterium]|nr:diguanylate cyclase [Pseudomonadota bacterium]MBU4278513.1 diguanylate cyclase [Pseudomonadota bacterium]MBU4382149.1 diguanylate cyclase [Pseudomonadota bacterium]MCG2763025.1 diguanylate cyclase [Desulfarculaceae bacterium]